MASLHISLPESLKAFVDGKVAGGSFKDASEYFSALVREDARTNAREQLDALLHEGLGSEEGPWDDAAREAIRREGTDRR